MKLKKETRRKLLLLYVRFFHRGQKRKVNGEAYYKHPLRVAEHSMKFYPTGVSFEIGLCHDLFEDTSCTPSRLDWFLKLIGYNFTDKARIVAGVLDLTTKYTPEVYPQHNRSSRKRREAIRLSQCSPMIQTIKYCDFMDNMTDVLSMDTDYANMSLNEKCIALGMMTDGNKNLRNILLTNADLAIKSLKKRL